MTSNPSQPPPRYRRSIATVSLSGVLRTKLEAIAAAGFDGVEIFDNDLVASPHPPREVAGICADLGLRIELFQPIRDAEGVPPDRFDQVLHRVERKLEVMGELGVGTALVCSNVSRTAVDDPGLRAEQLHRLGTLAATHGATLAYEALAWGRHVNRVRESWDAVRRADHPAVTLAVDTFHVLARGDDGSSLAGIPGDRIGFLQVADAPHLEMNILEWSRHHRCFPGQGTLDVTGVVRAVLDAGYDGPLSLEIFSDVVRELDPAVTARDGMRSLVYLEDRLAGTLAPVPDRVDPAFTELAVPPGDDTAANLLTRLGFRETGRHHGKPVTRWTNGGAEVLVNEVPGTAVPVASAVGVVAPPVSDIAARARDLLWPSPVTVRAEGDALLPAVSTPSGVQVFVSDTAGRPDAWQNDFDPIDEAVDPDGGWLRLDHVAMAVPSDRLNEETSFHRTILGLESAPMEEFIEPHGRLLSRALRPGSGRARMILNVLDRPAGSAPAQGITQLAFACASLLDEVARLEKEGVELMPVPDNYYRDLDARFQLPPAILTVLAEHRVLYDRDDNGGELLQVYLAEQPFGCWIELLERRGGYDGYGAANTHVRLAAR